MIPRISLDLDGKPRMVAENRAKWIAYWFNVVTKLYETNNGYHVESGLISDKYDLSPERLLSIRELLNDDPNRIRMDMERIERGWEWDVLFFSKKGHERKEIGRVLPGSWQIIT